MSRRGFCIRRIGWRRKLIECSCRHGQRQGSNRILQNGIAYSYAVLLFLAVSCSSALFPFDDALQILFHLLIGQGGYGNTDPGDQFHFKPPDGDDKQRVYQIAPAERVEQFRQFLCDLTDGAVTGDHPVNADKLGFPALALHIQDRIGIDENRLRPTSDWQAPPGWALQQQAADKMRRPPEAVSARKQRWLPEEYWF